LDKTPYFHDAQYDIRKDDDTLKVGNSAVDLDEPCVIAVTGKRFKLKRGLWYLLTNNDVIQTPFLLRIYDDIKAFWR
jgi:hypothetical protein